ncbi:MAG: hypothetical protein IJV48_01455 [Ruminococcus sp.]|nr:hypothetical protein [Ruminococcus sp.]
MKFPNAEKGIGKIFAAEILALIGSICVVAAAIFAALAIGNENGTMLILAGVFTIIMAIVTVISYIINIVGIAQASKDEGNHFKTALILTIFGIVFTIVMAILGNAFPNNEIVTSLSNTTPDLINLFVMIAIILGVRNLAIQLKDSAVERKGSNILKVLICIGIITLVARFVATLITNSVGAVISVIILCVAGILSIVLYVLYLFYLSKAKKMLK